MRVLPRLIGGCYQGWQGFTRGGRRVFAVSKLILFDLIKTYLGLFAWCNI